jgi:hypothetical protein
MTTYFLEQYWPDESRHRGDLYLWFHEKKVKKDREFKAGDRVLFYEVGIRPEDGFAGAKTLFASGTLTDDREVIPEGDQVFGGKRWLFKRRALTEYSVPPENGIPLAELKRVFGYRGWPEQGFKISKDKFEELEAELARRQETLNASASDPIGGPKGRRQSKEGPYVDEEPVAITPSDIEGDPEERAARLEKSSNAHRALLRKLNSLLKKVGFRTSKNPQVDLFATRPGEEWIFEVKSTHGGNLLSQVRHGIAQLYEYRYLYRGADPMIAMCLVLQTAPGHDLAWLADYASKDRGIHLCWSVEDGFATTEANALSFLRKSK